MGGCADGRTAGLLAVAARHLDVGLAGRRREHSLSAVGLARVAVALNGAGAVQLHVAAGRGRRAGRRARSEEQWGLWLSDSKLKSTKASDPKATDHHAAGRMCKMRCRLPDIYSASLLAGVPQCRHVSRLAHS